MKPPKSISESMIEETETENVKDIMVYDLIEEIDAITDLGIRSFVKAILIRADPFWEACASASHLTHPPDEHSEGGMVLHTKRVCRTVYLLSNTFDCTIHDLDIMIAAALLHDITKATWRDENKKEIIHDVMHPYTVDAFIAYCTVEDISTIHGTTDSVAISNETLSKILRLIRCSHGAFSPIPETIPVAILEKILHIADLVASNLHIIIDGSDVVEERWILPTEM